MNEALAGGEVDVIGLGRPLCVDPDFPRRLLAGDLDEAPDVESGLRLGRGWLGPDSPVALIKMANAFGRIGWWYEQIYRLADGQEPDLGLSALKALLAYDRTEKAKARDLARATSESSAPSGG
jgi:hypothetical protein